VSPGAGVPLARGADRLGVVAELHCVDALAVAMEDGVAEPDLAVACDASLRELSGEPACGFCAMPLPTAGSPCPYCEGRGVAHYDCIARLGTFHDPLRALIHRLPFVHPQTDGPAHIEARATARVAAELMVPTAVVREDAPLREAIAAMLDGRHKIIAVIDGGQRLVGCRDRADLLRGLLPGTGGSGSGSGSVR
jgi:CBS domain-containing protein